MKTAFISAGFFPTKDYEAVGKRLEACCQLHDLNLTTYGINETFQFFDSKIRKLASFLNQLKGDGYTHALYTDFRDSLILCGMDEVIEKYETFEEPLVLSAEKSCYPFGFLTDKFPESPTPYRFFNAGGWFGQIQYTMETLQKLQTYWHMNNNDNAHWMQGYANKRIDFVWDKHCKIFQTMSDCEFNKEFYFKENRLYNRETGTQPCIVHFNGPKGPGTEMDRLMELTFNKCIEEVKHHEVTN